MFGEKNSAGRNRCTICVERIKAASTRINNAPKGRRVNPVRLAKHITIAMDARAEFISDFA
jgi:hypothetical protein